MALGSIVLPAVATAGSLFATSWLFVACCGLPAELDTIRRVTSVVNDPSTLRGWLAAWRLLHVCARFPWMGDRDPCLVAIRTGLHKRLGPLPLKRRCRKHLLRNVLRSAARKQLWEVGALAVLAHTCRANTAITRC